MMINHLTSIYGLYVVLASVPTLCLQSEASLETAIADSKYLGVTIINGYKF